MKLIKLHDDQLDALFSLEKTHLSHLLLKFQTATSKVAMRTLSHDIAIHCSIMEELEECV